MVVPSDAIDFVSTHWYNASRRRATTPQSFVDKMTLFTFRWVVVSRFVRDQLSIIIIVIMIVIILKVRFNSTVRRLAVCPRRDVS